MPKDDYTSTPGGLKLKGAKNAGISKNKKKKTKVKPAESSPAQASLIDDPTELANPAEQRPQSSGAAAESSLDADVQREDDAEMNARSRSPAGSASPAPTPSGETKTEAERRHEEMRRKRVCFLPIPSSLRSSQCIHHIRTVIERLMWKGYSYPSASPAKA